MAASLSSEETVQLFQQYVIPNYVRYPVNLVRGEGSWVWDSEDRRYLDLFPGWGCHLLGHCPPAVVQAGQEQVAQLIHVPMISWSTMQGRSNGRLLQTIPMKCGTRSLKSISTHSSS